jgi:hypothetical protein
MFKSIGVVGILFVAGAYFTGALGGMGYSRDVSRPQTEVMTALEHLDITAQPGAPGSTASAAGGILPIFRLEKTANSMTWFVMSGEKVATKMTASFEPIDGGKETRVTTSVERGDAPDDFISPAFRSKGLTMGLFGMAIESELNKLVAPAAADPAECRRMLDRFAEDNQADGLSDRTRGLSEAIGQTAKIAVRLSAMDAELRRNGCPTDRNPNEWHPVESQMAPADPMSRTIPHGRNADGVSFEPGQPMIDTRRK